MDSLKCRIAKVRDLYVEKTEVATESIFAKLTMPYWHDPVVSEIPGKTR